MKVSEQERYDEEYVAHKRGVNTVSYYSENIMHVIMESIYDANVSIKAHMAYLSSDIILPALLERSKHVNIELIISNTNNNRKHYSRYNDLLKAGVKIYSCGLSDWTKGIMHRKSVVIDDELLLGGSYNWTIPAEKNLEELFVIEDMNVISQVTKLFEETKLKSHALQYVVYKLGRSPECSIEHKNQIKVWWDNIAPNWQELFRKKFSLPDIPTLDQLNSFTSCRSLVVNFNNTISDIHPLEIFLNLRQLTVYNCKNVIDISAVEKLIHLEVLDIAATAVRDLSPVSKLKNLKELNISNTPVTNIDPLNGLELESLILYNVDLMGFFERPKPKFFQLHPNCKVNFE